MIELFSHIPLPAELLALARPKGPKPRILEELQVATYPEIFGERLESEKAPGESEGPAPVAKKL